MGEIDKLCKRIALIHKGRLQFAGALEQLRAQYGKEDLDELFMTVVEGSGR
ncbi:Uncharacterised protein [Mycobacterium tuberculosis]|nr:Uncharacterised protein [Mycobacterium tuberculosis]